MIFGRLLIAPIVIAAICFTVVSGNAHAAPSPKFIGSWTLYWSNPSGGGPKSATLVISDAGGGKWKTTVDVVAANNSKAHTEETYAIDGKDYPVIGDPTTDTDAYASPDSSTLVITSKKAGKIISTVTTKLSIDGSKMTAVVLRTGADGKQATTTDVWKRQ